jgi:HEAT repeat protein
MQLAAALWLHLLIPPVQQPAPAPAAETRFHRVFLKNGNFIDGDLQRIEAETVVLRLKSGDLGINRDLVERIEIVKMKAADEAPPKVDLPARSAEELRKIEAAESPAPRVAPAFAAPPAVKAAVDPLASRLAKAPPEEVDSLLRELSLLGAETHPYMASLMERSDAVTAEHLGSVLAQTRSPATAPFLRRLLKHPAPQVRAVAAQALASNGGAAEVPALTELFKDGHAQVRGAAATAVIALDGEGAFKALCGLVQDPERSVRSPVLGALGALAKQPETKAAFADALADALAKAPPPVKADAALALGRSRAPGAPSLLRAQFGDAAAEVRVAAAAALGEHGGDEAAEAVASRMDLEGDAAVRISLSQAAESLRTKAAIPALIGYLGEERDEVRRAALGALKTLSGKDFGRDPDKWAAWWDAQPR